MLQELPAQQRADAANSLVYEAKARMRDCLRLHWCYLLFQQQQVSKDPGVARPRQVRDPLGPDAARRWSCIVNFSCCHASTGKATTPSSSPLVGDGMRGLWQPTLCKIA